MILEVSAFLGLAAQCARDVAPDTLLAIARHESGLSLWVLNDNTKGESLRYDTREAAEAEGRRRLQLGRSVDFGLMQINSTNFGWLNVSLDTVFEPCTNVAAGAAVLKRAYAQAVATAGEGPAALRMALSLYNTGDPNAGITRGYVGRVEGVASSYVVPPLTRAGDQAAGSYRAHPITAKPARPAPASGLEVRLDPFAAGLGSMNALGNVNLAPSRRPPVVQSVGGDER